MMLEYWVKDRWDATRSCCVLSADRILSWWDNYGQVVNVAEGCSWTLHITVATPACRERDVEQCIAVAAGDTFQETGVVEETATCRAAVFLRVGSDLEDSRQR